MKTPLNSREVPMPDKKPHPATNAAPDDTATGRYAYEGLDRVLHEKARLGIMTSLMTHPDGLVFNELKELCLLTDGNLSRHLDTLHEAGFIEIQKTHVGRRPQTTLLPTPAGRQRFLGYLAELERVLRDALPAAEAAAPSAPAPSPLPKKIPPGWVPA